MPKGIRQAVSTGKFSVTCAALIFTFVSAACKRDSDLAKNGGEGSAQAKNCATAPFKSGERINHPSYAVICPDGQVDSTPPSLIASPAGGSFGAVQFVTIQPSEANVTTYYTTDGTLPDSNSIKYTGPIRVDGNMRLRFYGVDLAGNVSNYYEANYLVSLNAPTVSLIYQTRTAISAVRSPIGDPSFDLNWQSDKHGTYRVEIGGNGNPNSGINVSSGPVVKDSPMTTTILGRDLQVNDSNKVYVYVTTDDGAVGYFYVLMQRDDTAPDSLVTKPGGDYGAAQYIAISADAGETSGIGYIYYTTDGSDPAVAETEPDNDGDGNSDVCQIEPFRPGLGKRCVVYNSAYTNSVKIEPYLPSGCVVNVPGNDCISSVKLRYFAIDKAGNWEAAREQTYNIYMKDPALSYELLSSTRVRGFGSIRLKFRSTGDLSAWQLAVGGAKEWGTGLVVTSGNALLANAEQTVSIPGTALQNGSTSQIVIRGKDRIGHVGATSVAAFRDDTPPTVGVSNPAGLYTREAALQLHLMITNPEDIAGGKIYYTLDGTEPSVNSAEYSGPISMPVNQTKTVRYFAVDAAGNVSMTSSATYEVVYGVAMAVEVTYTFPDDTAPGWQLVKPPRDTDYAYVRVTNPFAFEMEFRTVIRDGFCHALGGGTSTGGIVRIPGNDSADILVPSFLIKSQWDNPHVCIFTKTVGGATEQTTSLAIVIDRTKPVVKFEPNTSDARRLARGGYESSTIKFEVNEKGTYEIRQIASCLTADQRRDLDTKVLTCKDQPTEAERTSCLNELTFPGYTTTLASGNILTPGQQISVNLNVGQFANDGIPKCFAIVATDEAGNVSTYGDGTFFGDNAGNGVDDTGWVIRNDAPSPFNLAGVSCINKQKCNLNFTVGTVASAQSVFCNGATCTNRGTVSTGSTVAELSLTEIASVTNSSNDFSWLRSFIETASVVVKGYAGEDMYWRAFTVVQSNYMLPWFCPGCSPPMCSELSVLQTEKYTSTALAGFSGSWDDPLKMRKFTLSGTCLQNHRSRCQYFCDEYDVVTYHYQRQNPAIDYLAVAQGNVTSALGSNFNWNTASITTYSYQGSKVFTYTNPFGLKSSLLVNCVRGAGCSGNPF